MLTYVSFYIFQADTDHNAAFVHSYRKWLLDVEEIVGRYIPEVR